MELTGFDAGIFQRGRIRAPAGVVGSVQGGGQVAFFGNSVKNVKCVLSVAASSGHAAVPSARRSQWSRHVPPLPTQRESEVRSVAPCLWSRGLLRLSVGHHESHSAAYFLRPRRRDSSAVGAAGSVQCQCRHFLIYANMPKR